MREALQATGMKTKRETVEPACGSRRFADCAAKWIGRAISKPCGATVDPGRFQCLDRLFQRIHELASREAGPVAGQRTAGYRRLDSYGGAAGFHPGTRVQPSQENADRTDDRRVRWTGNCDPSGTEHPFPS